MKKCSWCGKEFESKSHDPFCSKECAADWLCCDEDDYSADEYCDEELEDLSDLHN